MVVAASLAASTWLPDGLAAPPEAINRISPVRTVLVQETNRFALLMSAIDPITLAPISGLAPLPVGHHYVDATSPDGGTLALIGWPTDSGSGGRLQMLDLERWNVHKTEAAIDGNVNALTFAPDGDSLYWTLAPETAAPPSTDLVRAAAATGVETARLSLPRSLVPWDFRPTRDGRVAIFAVSVDASWLSGDPPRVVIVDPAAGRVLANVQLDGVVAGQRRTEGGGYESFRPGLAWDMARGRLYVVDANDDRLTVVDLGSGRVSKSIDLKRAQTPLEALGEWLAPSAEAKVLPGTDRTAVLDPEGRRLYVATLRRTFSDNFREYSEAPMGGFVVDTDSLQIVGPIEQPVSELALSPDGARLLATGTEVLSVHDQTGSETPHGLDVLDPLTLKLLAHIPSGDRMGVVGFSSDSRLAYLQTWEYKPDGSPVCVLRSLRLDTFDIAGERRISGCYHLIATPTA